MELHQLREYCLSKPGTSEYTPFDEDTIVFRVMGKIFAITSISQYEFVNLKCDPDYALELRSEHADIKPGWHMNKAHWNSVFPTVGEKLMKSLVDHSYDLIVSKLPKKDKVELQKLQ